MSNEQSSADIPAPETPPDLGSDSIGRRRRVIVKFQEDQTTPQRYGFAVLDGLELHFQSREIWIAVVLGVGVGLIGALSL
jgi:hypothetical protein